jgi:hypothetical protein
LLIFFMSLMCLCLKFINVQWYNNWAFGLCFHAKILLVYYMTLFFYILFLSRMVGGHAKHYVSDSSKTMFMMTHLCTNLIIWFATSLTFFGWIFLCCLLSCVSTISLLQMICFFSYLRSLAHVLCSKWYRWSEDAMFFACCIQVQNSNLCTKLGELPHFI